MMISEYSAGHSPPPIPIESWGTHAHSPSPEADPPPPSQEKDIPPISGITIGNIKKTSPFQGFRGKTSRVSDQRIPLSRENWNIHVAPLYIRMKGGGGVTDLTVILKSEESI